jgi:hypothetical protein
MVKQSTELQYVGYVATCGYNALQVTRSYLLIQDTF